MKCSPKPPDDPSPGPDFHRLIPLEQLNQLLDANGIFTAWNIDDDYFVFTENKVIIPVANAGPAADFAWGCERLSYFEPRFCFRRKTNIKMRF